MHSATDNDQWTILAPDDMSWERATKHGQITLLGKMPREKSWKIPCLGKCPSLFGTLSSSHVLVCDFSKGASSWDADRSAFGDYSSNNKWSQDRALSTRSWHLLCLDSHRVSGPSFIRSSVDKVNNMETFCSLQGRECIPTEGKPKRRNVAVISLCRRISWHRKCRSAPESTAIWHTPLSCAIHPYPLHSS